MPSTPEGKIVRLSDKIAYVNSDIDDAIRARILTEEDIPKEIRKVLGSSVRERLDRLIHDVVMNSMDSPDIHMSVEVQEAMLELRQYLFAHVYRNPEAKSEEIKAKRMIHMLYDYYMSQPAALPDKYLRKVEDGEETKERIICDYISGMTDSYAVAKFSESFVPLSWEVEGY